MDLAAQLKRGISRQFSTGSMKRTFSRQFTRQSSLDPRRNNMRFSFGRQSSLDPIRRSPDQGDALAVPENLDSTMQLLFMACRGDVRGVEDLLNEGIDVNSIDLDGRTGLHIAACEGHVEVVKLLLSRRANIDARDRWGSTVNSPPSLTVSRLVFGGLYLVNSVGGFPFPVGVSFALFPSLAVHVITRARIHPRHSSSFALPVNCTLLSFIV